MPNGPMPDAPPDPVAAFERARKEVLRQKRVQTTVFFGVFLACLVAAIIVGQFNLVTLINGFPRTTEYIEQLLPVLRWETLGADVSDWYWNLGGWLDLLVETLLMAFFATLLGTLGAFALSFTASSNLMSTYLIYFTTRRFLEIARSVPDLVYALVFVFAWGLGPLAGILALAIHSMGASGKLFAEVNENIDPNPVEVFAPPAATGSRPSAIRSCRRYFRPSLPIRCGGSRSTCVRPRCLASSEPAGSVTSSTPTSACPTTRTWVRFC